MQLSHAPKISPEVNGCFAGNDALPGSDSRFAAARTEALASLAIVPVLQKQLKSTEATNGRGSKRIRPKQVEPEPRHKNLFVKDGSSFVLLRKREL